MNGCEIGLIKNGVLDRKQNNICIGLKNYYVLAAQQQNIQLEVGPDVQMWEHISHESLMSSDESSGTGIRKCVLAHCVGGRVYFGEGCIGMGFKFLVKMRSKVGGEYLTV